MGEASGRERSHGSVEADGAEPKRSARTLWCSMSAVSACEHQHRLDERPCLVVKWYAFPSRREPRRERIPDVQPSGKGSKNMQSDMGYHLVTVGCHDEATSAVVVHFVSTFLVGDWVFRQPQLPLTGGQLRGCTPFSSCSSVNDWSRGSRVQLRSKPSAWIESLRNWRHAMGTAGTESQSILRARMDIADLVNRYAERDRCPRLGTSSFLFLTRDDSGLSLTRRTRSSRLK